MYAGRRNGTIDVWDARQLGISGPLGTPRLLRTLRNPSSSGVVSCVAALPDCRHLAWLVFCKVFEWEAKLFQLVLLSTTCAFGMLLKPPNLTCLSSRKVVYSSK